MSGLQYRADVDDGMVTITSAQLGCLLGSIGWRMTQHTWRPQAAG